MSVFASLIVLSFHQNAYWTPTLCLAQSWTQWKQGQRPTWSQSTAKTIGKGRGLWNWRSVSERERKNEKQHEKFQKHRWRKSSKMTWQWVSERDLMWLASQATTVLRRFSAGEEMTVLLFCFDSVMSSFGPVAFCPTGTLSRSAPSDWKYNVRCLCEFNVSCSYT